MSELSVAVIGASQDRRKFGNKAVRAYRRLGYTVFPVNPREKEVEGLPAYPSIASLPASVDVVSLYVPPKVGSKLLAEIAAAKPREIWLNPGTQSEELLKTAADLHLRTVLGCSIVALGLSPSQFPDE